MWLWFALSAPLFFALSGILDKYLLTKVMSNLSSGAITLLAGLTSFPMAIIFGVFAWGELTSVTASQAALAFASGGFIVAGYYYYFRSLEKTDVSLVYAIFQLTIVFTYLGGRLFLGETLTPLQGLAMVLISGGSLVLTIENHEGKWRFRKKLLILLLVSTLLYSVGQLVFKAAALDTGFMATQFFNYVGYSLVSIAFVFHAATRRSFGQTVRTKGGKVWVLAGLNEGVYVVGMVLANYALVLVPVALVQAVVSIETLYLIVMGALLTYFFPKIIKENVSRGHMLFKIGATLVIIGGTALLAV